MFRWVVMTVRLIKKLADVVNGIDVSDCSEGDVIELPTHHAEMLIAEGWAELVAWRPDRRAVAADRGRRHRPDGRPKRETE